jgi:hypothetical protein
MADEIWFWGAVLVERDAPGAAKLSKLVEATVQSRGDPQIGVI